MYSTALPHINPLLSETAQNNQVHLTISHPTTSQDVVDELGKMLLIKGERERFGMRKSGVEPEACMVHDANPILCMSCQILCLLITMGQTTTCRDLNGTDVRAVPAKKLNK